MKWLRLTGIAILAINLLFTPALNAQPAAKTFRIAVLGNQDNPPWEGLRQGLRDLGYIDGRNVRIDWRWSEGLPDGLPALARELVALEPDVIVVSGTQAAQAASDATRTIPIVMALSQDPEKVGLVQSLSRPGGNVTGLSTYSPQLMAKKLEVLKEVAPTIVRVACLWDPTSLSQQLQLRDLQAATAVASVTFTSIEARSPDAVPSALAAVNWTRGDALLVIGNPITFKTRHAIVDFARAKQIPSVFEERLFVELGGLVSYGPSFAAQFRRAATFVDKILKGAKPADLPVEQPTRFELVINGKTARALGLTISPSLLLRADQVIE
jgi:putative ABC transport system substrate-binding protein